MAEDRKSAPLTSLSVWLVLAGAVLGVFTGLFLGDAAAPLRAIGQVYVLLLEVAVYPYLICSLLHGLGKLTPAEARRLLAAGWKFYAILFMVVVLVLLALAMGLPAAEPLALVPAHGGSQHGIAEMLIPSDPFTALSRNYVPAVIIFCATFGIALQQVKEKESLLATLESFRLASLAFWKGVVPFAPLAVFSLFAAEAGTLRHAQAESILVFLLLFFVGTLGLTFWVLPMLVSALIPIGARELLRELRQALVIAVVTTLSVAALPFITAATRRFVEKCGVQDSDRDEIISTNLSIAYPLGQLGNYFVYLFMIFAAAFYGVTIDALHKLILPGITLVSCVGSPTSSVDAVAFLAQWLGLPAGTTSFYVGLMALTRYGQVLVSVVGFGFLSFTVVAAYYGKLRLRPGRLILVAAVTLVAALGAATGARMLTAHLEGRTSNPYLHLSVAPELVAAVTLSGKAGVPAVINPDEAVLSRIQRTGVLRVGVNASIIPFCYRNAAGELAGYDVAFAYRLAADLNARLSFVPFEWASLKTDLQAGRFDIAMSGIYVTEDRLAALEVSEPYYQSPLALFMPRERAPQFRSRQAIVSRSDLRLGVFDDPVLLPRVRLTFPNARIVVVRDYTKPPDFQQIDAAVWTLEQASALAAANPGLIAVEPSDAGNPYLFAYMIPPNSQEFVRFINYWLELKKSEGFEAEQQDYWIHLQPRKDTSPRWSILHNMLGFGRSKPAN